MSGDLDLLEQFFFLNSNGKIEGVDLEDVIGMVPPSDIVLLQPLYIALYYTFLRIKTTQ